MAQNRKTEEASGPRARRMRGIGELLSAPLALPKLSAVLVNLLAVPLVLGLRFKPSR